MLLAILFARRFVETRIAGGIGSPFSSFALDGLPFLELRAASRRADLGFTFYRRRNMEQRKEEARNAVLSSIFRQQKAKDVLLECKLKHRAKGSKTWELELSLFHVMFQVGRLVVGKPFYGFIACHKNGAFVTYAVNIAGRECWFDRLENALRALC